MQPLLIADSGGTKTDWCFVDSLGVKHFFTTESYHPQNWSTDFLERIDGFWLNHSQYKTAELHFFCAGCFKEEKSKELTQIFNKLGFSKVIVQSDLHAAALSLYGNENGYCAILGTGSVFFEWKDNKVVSISGGKGYETGDEGSGFYFGKLVYQAYLNDELNEKQKFIFESEVDLIKIEESIKLKNTKKEFSEISYRLKDYSEVFTNWHKCNVNLFFEDIWKHNSPLTLSVIGGYFSANSTILIPYLKEKQIHIQKFSARPIDSLVDYFVYLTE